MSDLRDSGAIEQDGDTVLFAYREAYYLSRITFDDPNQEALRVARLREVEHLLEIIVAKARNGPDGTVKLFCDMASNVVADMDRRAA